MKIWHLRISSDGRHPLFPTEQQRRAAVLLLARRAGPWLVAFGIVDDHLHLELVCSRVRAGKLSRAVLLGLRPIAEVGFEPSFIKPVESRAHLLRLVGYCIEQPRRHGLGEHPALWSGSCFPDLVGARAIDGLRLRIGEVLPRYRAADAWRAAGLTADGISLLEDVQVLGIGLSALCDAASFASCAHPRLVGRSAHETSARAAVVCLGRRAGYRSVDIARSLGITSEAVRQLGHRPPAARVLSAIRRRLAIEQTLTGTPRFRRR